MSENEQATCAERIGAEYESTMDTVRQLWEGYKVDPEAYVGDIGRWDEYGLCFDYVAPHTFKDQDEGYFRYQISYGGPSDEFRFFATYENEYKISVYRVEYWFLDWYDGAHKIVLGDDLKLMEEIFESDWVDTGTAAKVYNDAMEDYDPDDMENYAPEEDEEEKEESSAFEFDDGNDEEEWIGD